MGSRLSDLGRRGLCGPNASALAATSNQPLKEEDAMDGLSKNAYERRIARLENEKRELTRKLADSNKALQKLAHGPLAVGLKATDDGGDEGAGDSNRQEEVRKLHDEVNKLTKRNSGESSNNE